MTRHAQHVTAVSRVSQGGDAFHRRRRHISVAAGALAVGLLAACGGSSPAATPAGDQSTGASGEQIALSIVAFKPPSLGAFLPAVIESRDIDAKHNLDIKFTYATPDNYNTEFGAGHYDLGGSAGLLSEALRTQRGVDVTYLFNICDFFGTVVTSKDGVNSLKDLEGRTLAAATGTTNYAMFSWFAKRDAVDVNKIKLLNQTTAGLSTMAQTGRADAVELWEPAYSTLLSKNKDIRTIDLNLNAWSQEFGTTDIPYLGMAAQAGWAKANPDAVQALYDTYKDAAEWVLANPKEAGALIAKTIPSGNADVIQKLIETNDASLKLNVAPASELAKGMKGVFTAGEQIGYLKQQPPESIIYQGIKR
jgi:NitT/TauT family transport system substrate-binding protein